jgi:hypothetical protein
MRRRWYLRHQSVGAIRAVLTSLVRRMYPHPAHWDTRSHLHVDRALPINLCCTARTDADGAQSGKHGWFWQMLYALVNDVDFASAIFFLKKNL